MGCRWFGGCLVLALALSGCGSDLGECNEALLGGPAAGASGPYTGQIVMSSCASGFCHSSAAMGEARNGVPAGFNFDVISPDPAVLEAGSRTVRDEAEEIWAEVEGGAMPPPAPAGSGELDETSKDALRNWLACGAPLAPTAPTTDPWSTIHTTLAANCNGCHGTAGFMTLGDGFLLGEDPCTAWRNVVSRPAVSVSGGCATSGAQLVVPNNAGTSLLLQKLRGTQTCGSHMPLTSATPFETTDPATVAALDAWITSGAPAPTGCTP